ncbi:MAG: urea ABC transporter permease subunit UrtB [Beijerinckiaceae bacterium]|nr:urea ABC transporter permease subunit UrtB [Beijerinckiaceae bacterium]
MSLARLCCALLLALIVTAHVSSGAHAADLQSALARMAADDFAETATAIEEIADTGAPQAETILSALSAARLFFDPATKKVYWRTQAGVVHDALSGEPVATPPAPLETVRINNRLRRVLANAIGGLTLMAPEPQRRRSAADAIFRSRDESALPLVEEALKAEKLPAVSRALQHARAAILVTSPETSKEQRVEAIGTLRDRADMGAIAALRSLDAKADAETKELAAAAITTIEDRLRLVGYVQNIWYGLSLGSVLLLAAIGLAITFGVMGVINMAHGEMVMLGAYTTFMVQEFLRANAPHLLEMSLTIALPLAFLFTGLIGVCIERGVIRFLYGRPLETLLATWGISLILQQSVRTIFGPTNREVGSPSYMSGAFDFMGMSITWGRLWIIVFTMIVFFMLLLALKYTSMGLHMRAVTQNRRMASAMGIRTPWVDAMTFGLGSGLAGIAGVALSQIDNVSPNLGQTYIIDSFMVVVFGGVGNLWGTLVSAFALGIANKFLEPVAGAVLAKILILVLLILFIQKRPRGLFALKGRAVEA